MTKESPWAAVVNAAGAAGAAIASVYAVGSIVMSLRYEGFGLSGQEAVAVTPREVLLFAGTRSLVIWAAVGFVIRSPCGGSTRTPQTRSSRGSGVRPGSRCSRPSSSCLSSCCTSSGRSPSSSRCSCS
jgi:hypothetical protein